MTMKSSSPNHSPMKILEELENMHNSPQNGDVNASKRRIHLSTSLPSDTKSHNLVYTSSFRSSDYMIPSTSPPSTNKTHTPKSSPNGISQSPSSHSTVSHRSSFSLSGGSSFRTYLINNMVTIRHDLEKPRARSNSNPQGVDYITKLPTPILNYVLFFLCSKDVNKCRLLSKTFQQIISRYKQNLLQFYFNRDLCHLSDINLRLYGLQQELLWEEMIKDWDTWKKSPDKVSQFVRLGIAPSFRHKVWQKFTNSQSLQLKNKEIYEFCVNKVTQEEPAIKKDIGRTFPDHPAFECDKGPAYHKLYRVLRAFSNFNELKEVAYCQGINYLTGVILLVIPSEEEAFWTLIHLMKNSFYHLEYLFRKGLAGLIKKNAIFDSMVEKFIPELSFTFKQLGLTSNMFASKWFLTLFGCKLPLPDVIRIWDLFILHGWEAIMRISLAILIHSKDFLLKAPLEDIFVYFDHLPKETIEINRLFRTAFSFELDEELLQKIQASDENT